MTELKQGPISWEDAAAVDEVYAEVLETEELGHGLYVDEHDTIRWVENPLREQEIMDEFSASDLNDLYIKGAEKNDPLVRELYKNIGYSLFGFWEIFYWRLNNSKAHLYTGRLERNEIKIKDMFGNELTVDDTVAATPPNYKWCVSCKVIAIDERGYVDLVYYYNKHSYETFRAMWDQVAKDTTKR